MKGSTVINIFAVRPNRYLIIVRNQELFILIQCNQTGIGLFPQIHAIHHMIQHQIKLLFTVQVYQPIHLGSKHRIGLVVGNIDQFLYGILGTVISINPDSHLSLMSAPVHIAINHKLNVAALMYIQYSNTMLGVHCPRVCILRIIKAKDHCQLIGFHIIAKKPSRHLKHNHISVFALHHGYLRICDTQEQFVITAHFSGVRYLCHGSLKIQQIHSIRGIAQAVVLFHHIISSVFPFLCRYDIIGSQGRRLLRNLHKARHRFAHFPDPQVTPGNLPETAMNIYLVKRAVIFQLGVGLQIFCKFPCSLLII